MSRARSDWKLICFMSAVLLVPAAACSPQGEQSAAPEASAAQKPDTGQPAAGAALAESVKKAAGIARAIRADPESMDRILEGEGITREEFEDLLYEIAADPALSEAYVRELGG